MSSCRKFAPFVQPGRQNILVVLRQLVSLC